jgi:wyosine [tRNA(Phe)-imidazoG37] synthetase (radical SAM superfamily)
LGQSLGIDPIPLKTCNWNCVYCQLGRTKPVVNERKDYFPPREILIQVEQTLGAHGPGEIDWITFVGSGEPTLHASIGEMIRQVKAMTNLPVAVITNGALLYRPRVRDELAAADVVLPSLDAGTPELYRKINRPHSQITFERHLEGLTAFRKQYNGRLWLEVMLVRGLNDTETALRDLAVAINRIHPDEVHINLPSRPPVETWVQPPKNEALMRARAILSGTVKVIHPVEGSFDLGGYNDIVDAVVGIITRHPMREDELKRTLTRWSPDEVSQSLEDLKNSGRAQLVERYGVQFWSAAGSYYPDELQSQATAPGRRHHDRQNRSS